jgi:hypothetical protein
MASRFVFELDGRRAERNAAEMNGRGFRGRARSAGWQVRGAVRVSNDRQVRALDLEAIDFDARECAADKVDANRIGSKEGALIRG